MNKILVSVIVVIALLGLAGSMIVIAADALDDGSGGAGPISNGEPVVTISPTRGPSGTLVQVIASGFPANTIVSVAMGPQTPMAWDVAFTEVARGTTDADGVFSVEVPAEGEAGMDLVFAVVAEVQWGATSAEMFHITHDEPTVAISPTSGPSGTLVQVVASGFPGNAMVSVGMGPQNSEFSEVARGTTDASGIFSVQVPVQGAPGMDLVFAVVADGQPGITSADRFHITGGEPTVTISPTSGPSGTIVHVVASNFPANATVSVGMGPQNSEFSEVARGTTDASGVFSMQVPVQGAPSMVLVFAVVAKDQPGVISADVFHITY